MLASQRASAAEEMSEAEERLARDGGRLEEIERAEERERRIDAIDPDPCGSVAELLPSAVACLADGGLLLASCTDLGAMSGRFGELSAARYGAQPLKDAHKQAPELALRMLLGSVARAAGEPAKVAA